jgi:nucleotidyltransferase/DNA polymerase involved in DNA repair
MIAKIASDMRKPRGIVIVEPQEVEQFLRPLPVDRIWGVGKVTRSLLEEMGIRTVGELAAADPALLLSRLGRYGPELRQRARGNDQSPVEPPGEAKSIGAEHTFQTDTADLRRIEGTLMWLCERVAGRLREAGEAGRTVTTTVRFEDFTTLTRARTADCGLCEEEAIYDVALANLRRAWNGRRKVRLLGVSVSGFPRGAQRQTTLFDPARRPAPLHEKRRRLGEIVDEIKRRYGDDAIRRGTSMGADDHEGAQ